MRGAFRTRRDVKLIYACPTEFHPPPGQPLYLDTKSVEVKLLSGDPDICGVSGPYSTAQPCNFGLGESRAKWRRPQWVQKLDILGSHCLFFRQRQRMFGAGTGLGKAFIHSCCGEWGKDKLFVMHIFWSLAQRLFLWGKLTGSRGLMVRESAGIVGGGSEYPALSPSQYHAWGALEQGTKPPTAPRICRSINGYPLLRVCVHCCVCALWMGLMQSTHSEYGSPYLAVCYVTFTFLSILR